jgi:predicted AlkP superfamily phosphohydrolase/phosphomutase
MVAAGPVLMIGLDMGDGALLEQWAGAGRLPAIAALLAGGRAQRLATTADALHVSGWPSLYTGTHPGEHGVYYTFQPAPGHQGWLKFQAGQYGRPTFWTLLARAGVRCSVLDAPYTHPEQGGASQVIDWGSWAPYWKPASTPAALLDRLRRARGRYPLGFHALDVGMERLDPAEMSRKLVPAAKAKTEAARWLMAEQPWDLFFTVYGESHAAAHYCWGDEAALEAVYQEIDRGIGALVAAAGPEAAVYLVSGDGVGPNQAGWHLLPEVLRRLGYLAEPSQDGPGGPGAEAPAGRRSLDPVKLVRDLLPKDLRKAIARKLLPDALRHRLAQRVDTASVDWARTRAFCLPTDLEGYIRVNLRGREPQGAVAPGKEYRRVLDELTAALEALTHPESGRRAVRAVLRADDLYPGPRRDYLPDLIVLWTEGAPFPALSSPAVGTVTGASPDGRPGTHVPPGYLIRAGKGAGSLGRLGHIAEIAPELLRRFGVTVPDYMGRAPAALPGLEGGTT